MPLDRGVLFTGKELLTKPGKMLRGYLAGKRVGYTKPLQFLLIITAITLISFSRDDFERGMKTGMSSGMQSTPGDATKIAQVSEFQQNVADFISSHLTLLLLGMLPFVALTAKWFYRKHDVNYAEHFVMSCYLMAGCSIISFPFLTAMHFMGKSTFTPWATGGFLLMYVGYFIWGHLTFFAESNRIWNAIKAALVYLLAYLLYIVTFGLVGMIAAIVYFVLVKKG